MEEPTEPLFKPVRKRKFLRRKDSASAGAASTDTPSETTQEGVPADASPAGGEGDGGAATEHALEADEAEESILADIIRRKMTSRRKALGVGFTPESGSAAHSTPPSSSMDLARPAGEDGEKIQAITGRFVAHTGQKVDVDEHMMQYIESELAKRRQGLENQTAAPADPTAASASASLGKLHEVDLGPEIKLRNISLTEAATRGLAGDAPPADPTGPAPDGKNAAKSWKNRKRRTSDDIRRDQLVEEVLRESKLDVYDQADTANANEDKNLAADDRIAEQFRRDFMEALHSRRRRTRAKRQSKPGAGGKKVDAPRGPKLGGSRSARAAMRQKQLQEQQQKK
ncbi:hypothetical protein KEM52_000201 [Ascosphaera acerosa]|nr:hypothetical protein KEM52_000201 [Ascosphaera acerosa]